MLHTHALAEVRIKSYQLKRYQISKLLFLLQTILFKTFSGNVQLYTNSEVVSNDHVQPFLHRNIPGSHAESVSSEAINFLQLS